MIDIEEAADAVELFVHEPGRKLRRRDERPRLHRRRGRILAMTRKGKQVLNVPSGEEAAMCAPADGDSVAVIGDNRKLLLFPLAELRRCRAARGRLASRTAASPTPKCSARRRPCLYRRRRPLFRPYRIARLVGRARPTGRLQRLPQVWKVRPASSQAQRRSLGRAVVEPHPALRGEPFLRHEAVLVAHLPRALDPIAEIDERASEVPRVSDGRGSCRSRGRVAAGSGRRSCKPSRCRR